MARQSLVNNSSPFLFTFVKIKPLYVYFKRAQYSEFTAMNLGIYILDVNSRNVLSLDALEIKSRT